MEGTALVEDNSPTPSGVQRIKIDAGQRRPHSYEDAEAKAIVRDLIVRHRNVGAVLIIRAGAKSGALSRWIAPRSALSALGSLRVPVHGNRGDASVVGARICEDKALTKEVIGAQGVSTPRARRVSTAAQAKRFARDICAPVVIKPRFGTQGKGVSVNLRTDEEIDAAFSLLKNARYAMVEEFVRPVREYRVLATAEACHSVIRRIPPHVTGDGKSTIRSLIERKNRHRLTVPSTADTAIPMDSETERFLAEGGLTLDSVLADGITVGVRGVGGVSGGAEPMECFDDVDESVKSIAVAAVAAIPGLNWAGVDVIVDEGGNPQVIEVNSAADISCSAYPFYGEPRDLGKLVWERLVHRDAVKASLPTVIDTPLLEADPARAESDGVTSPVRVASLIADRLIADGISVTKLAPELISFDGPDGPAWFSGTGTLNDPVLAFAFMSIHGVVMRLAAVRGIPAAPYRTVNSPTQLRDALSGDDPSPRVTPYKSSWRGGLNDPEQFLKDWEEEGGGQRPVLVQDAIAGRHLRLAATPNGVLTVLGRELVTDSELASACEVARRTVAMIPQLNWAMVEVILPDDARLGSAMLEGIVGRPVVNPDDLVISGSIGRLLDYLVDLAVTQLPPYSAGDATVEAAKRDAGSIRRRVRHFRRRIGGLARRAAGRLKRGH